MKIHSLIPLLLVLTGCAASPATQILGSLPQGSGAQADLNPYNGKVHVFFTAQDSNVSIDKLQGKIGRDEVAALYTSDHKQQQKTFKECLTIQAKPLRYEPCYQSVGGLLKLQSESMFSQSSVNPGGVLGSIIAAPFQVAGAALNTVTLNPKGAADSIKGLGKGSIEHSVDQKAVQAMGRYLDDQIAQSQKNARQVLATYQANGIRQARNIPGLLKDSEYYQAFSKAKNHDQRLAVYQIIGLINGQEQHFDNFARIVLQSPADLPLWAETLSGTSHKPRLSLEQAKRIPKFAAQENLHDFFNSNEYRYVLQYLKPEKVTHSASGNRAMLNVSYGKGVNVVLQTNVSCRQTHSYTKSGTSHTGGIFRVFGFGSDYVTQDRVTEYTCTPSEQNLAQLRAWEQRLTGNTLASSQIPGSWKTKDTREVSREKIHYSTVGSPSSGSSSGSSSAGTQGSHKFLKQYIQGDVMYVEVRCSNGDIKTLGRYNRYHDSDTWHRGKPGLFSSTGHKNLRDAINAVCP